MIRKITILIFLCFSFSGCTSLPTSKESKSKHDISETKIKTSESENQNERTKQNTHPSPLKIDTSCLSVHDKDIESRKKDYYAEILSHYGKLDDEKKQSQIVDLSNKSNYEISRENFYKPTTRVQQSGQYRRHSVYSTPGGSHFESP